MHRFFVISLMVSLSLIFSACQKAASPKQDNGAQNVVRSITDGLKQQKMAGYESKTIGEAFDSYKYLVNKEWKEKPLAGRTVEISFIGWFPPEAPDDKTPKDGVIARGLEVKFDININGIYFVKMISRLEARSGGEITAYQLDDIASVLTKIYANKEIKF